MGQDRVKCRYCDHSLPKEWIDDDGNERSGIVEMADHFFLRHPKQYAACSSSLGISDDKIRYAKRISPAPFEEDDLLS